MNYSLKHHLIQGAHFLESPNQSERCTDRQIDLLIIHNISLPPGEFGTGCIDDLFCNRLDEQAHPFFEEIADLKVSTHLFIDRQGTVTQYVPLNKKAWHAGESSFDGSKNCNDFSIGIELEGTDTQAFADEQYTSLVSITKLLLEEYPCLNLDRIVGHSDVAPGRKTDPGPFFNWTRYKGALSE